MATREFWARVHGYAVLISDIVILEVRRIPDAVRRRDIEVLLEQFVLMPAGEEARALANRYLETGVFATGSEMDALHVAVASVAAPDAVASWNFQHMVKVRTIQRVNAANLDLGYRPIDIRSPLEL